MTRPDELRAQAEQLLAKAPELETPLSADDVHKLYVDRNYQAIEDARQDGRLDTLLNPTEGA